MEIDKYIVYNYKNNQFYDLGKQIRSCHKKMVMLVL